MLYVRQLTLGPMKNFIYLVGHADSKEVAVIDPAWDVPAMLDAADAEGKTVTAAILSHHHYDHLNGVPELLKRRDVPVYVQKAEHDFSDVIRGFGSAVKPMDPGAKVQVGKAELTLIHTPGHSPGSQCVLCQGALVSGDTVFVNACGRCDLGGGDPEAMFNSLHHVLGKLPNETVLYPGHDYGDVPVSSLGRERTNNPYFQLSELRSFVSRRMPGRS